jgi:hypothetical protein
MANRTDARTDETGPTREDRIAAVLTYAASHPRATERQMAAAFGLPKTTLHRYLSDGRRQTVERAADDYRAVMIARNETLIAALMPKALAGSFKHAEVILAADKRTAELMGLDAERKTTVRHVIEQMAKTLPSLDGVSVEDVIAEAERIIALAGQDAG